jgi:Flp pilus assembly protein TadD
LNGFRHSFRALLLCFSLGTTPAFAGLFDSSPAKPVAVNDETIVQIQSAFDDQRYLDASKILDQALVSHGDDPRLTYWVAQLSLVHGDYQEAVTNFASIKKDSNLHNLALAGEGVALLGLGRYDEAIVSLQAAVQGDSGAWRAWNALGTEYDRRHDWTNAEAAYANALSGSGNAAIVLNNRGYSWLSQKRPDLAIPDFVAALQKKPDLAVARSNLRLAMSMQGEYDRAIKGAPEADQAEVLNNAGFAAMLRGDYAKARELLTEAMKAKNGYYAIAAANLELTQNLAKGQ